MTLTFYAYVGNDPLNRIDPSGLEELPQFTQDILAPFFPGFDLGRINIHRDFPPRAGTLAEADGNDLYFSLNYYMPDTIQGIASIAHEVAHAIQDSAAPGSVFGPWDPYTVEVWIYGYENSSREVLARLKENEVRRALRRRFGVLNGDVRELSGANACR